MSEKKKSDETGKISTLKNELEVLSTEHSDNILKLEEYDERFQLLVSSIKDYAIFMLDSEGNVASWNTGAERIKGYKEEEIVGKHFSVFYPPEDKGWKPAMELKLVAKDGRFEDEGWRVRKDGSLFWANVIITALRDNNGKLIGFAKVTRDLTERRRAEKALFESEQRYRLMLDSVRDYMLIMLNNDGTIASWNKGAENIQGYRAEEIIGKHFSIFYIQEDLENGKPAKELETAIKHGTYEEEGWRIRKDRTRYWANVIITSVYNEKKELIGFSKVTKDLTERKAAEELLIKKNQELAASNSELEQFAYIASHDLQEPLRTISSYIQILDKRYGDKLDDKAREFMTFAKEGALRMKSLIDDLLKYSRVGKNKGNEKAIDLNAIVEVIINDLKTVYHDAEIKITTPLPKINATEVQMIQLFQNLISNAIKFRKKDVPPYIEISVVKQGAFWKFSVKDNGIGIEENFYDRIFHIFQRLHTREYYSGSGVGLAICKKIVELYKGKIWVDSKINEGTTFYFTLPIHYVPS